MNKQELIDKYTAEISRLRPYCPNRYLISEQLKYDLYKEILEDLKQLDEPQKPVVPKFVAEWFKEKEGGLENAIFYECVQVTDTYSKDYSEFQRWLVSAENKAIETLIRMLDGYEVEKEPLYSVIIAGEYLVKEISCSNEVKLVSTAYLPQYLAHHYQLTEKQIKEIDERYWPFAVPVEEEAEG
ncbi:DUF1642 domain-containing protein [Enterococcus lactis]|uniref:DUF1642 domain-containing protein n=1 Tax=Enterococcus lactis TaxID=357441 RepID=UPI00289249D1|nr:DUF1642 domain-containing protein [Enterococcus lactis]MDT2803230.1 DUF1642 domain-containing protein [Enterococcus lactis]